MCCGHESHHGHHHSGCCCCGGGSRLAPGFWTKEEKIAWLERYLEGLQEEAKAVEERLAKFKGEA